MVKHAKALIKKIQNGQIQILIPIFGEELEMLALLRSLNTKISRDEVRLLCKWRIQHADIFKDVKKPTIKGTERWFKGFKERILFMIEDDAPIGHMGLFRFDFKKDSVEIDNVVRGANHNKGIMTGALNSLIVWTKDNFKPKHIYLQVLQENTHAIEFYQRNRFKIVGETTLNGYKEFKMKYV